LPLPLPLPLPFIKISVILSDRRESKDLRLFLPPPFIEIIYHREQPKRGFLSQRHPPTLIYASGMDERTYFTYIVASRSHTLYIGITGDLRMRVYQHKEKLHPDGFAARYNCNRLVWFERFMCPGNAIKREKQLKGWSRAKKIALIEKSNPTCNDLSEGCYPKQPFPANNARTAGPSTPFGRSG
jgi:putative endonuclease